jgi:sulfur-oxidizing protein SoxX
MASPAVAAAFMASATGFAMVAVVPGVARGQAAVGAYAVLGDTIPASLTGAKGDAARGRNIAASRHIGLCLLCHSGPFPEERFQGTIGPDLRGTAARLSEGQIRLRIVDPSRVNPETVMPAYYRTEGLTRVAPAFRGGTVLSAEQIEDVVAFLATLRD